MISLRKISKSIADREVLKNLDLDINEGEIVVITGQNGCGKTTLFEILTGQIRANSGHLVVGSRSHDLSATNSAVVWERIYNRTLGGLRTCSQSAPLYEDLTLADHLALADPQIIDSLNGTNSYRDYERNPHIHLGQHSRENLTPSEMSFGERRVFAVTRQLSANPPMCLLDEPFAGLDASNARMLRRAIQEAKKKRSAVIIIEHESNLSNVIEIVDRMFEMRDGRLFEAESNDHDRSQRDEIKAEGIEPLPTDPVRPGFSFQFSTRDKTKSLPPLLRQFLDQWVSLDAPTLARIQAPNGWGKSTLANAMAGLANPFGFNASLSFDGMTYSDMGFAARRRSGLGLLRTTPHYPPKTKVKTVFETAGAQPDHRSHGFFDRTIESLSGGERRYVFLDVTLAQSDLRACILDEPFVGLDGKYRKICQQKVQEFAEDHIAIVLEPA